MKIKFSLCVLVALMSLSASAPTGNLLSYKGHMVVRVVPKNDGGLQLLRNFENQGIIKFWSEPSGVNRPVSFQITNARFELLSGILATQSMEPTVLVTDVQELIDKQKDEILQRKLQMANSKAFDFGNFHTYSEIQTFMQETAANNSLVSYSVIGESYKGLNIGQATIRTGNPGGKQIIYLECGIHAREWVAPSTCIWIFDQLANGYRVDPEVTALLDKYDWIIVPSTNPDGYEYTWNTDRLWRKNRAPTNNSSCIGIDLNRNYDANFGGDGSSSVACSETYHGTSAFSESESRAIRDSLSANRGLIKAYVSVHSYSGLWMSPYGYLNEVPVEYDEMYRVMKIGAEAITATYGKPFVYGNEASILYLTSGTSRDYAYVGQNIVYPYTIESRDASYGFIAPPREILPTAEEIWNGIKAMANNLQ